MHSPEIHETPLGQRDHETGLGSSCMGLILVAVGFGMTLAAPSVPHAWMLAALLGLSGLGLVGFGTVANEWRRRRLLSRVGELAGANRALRERALRKDEFLASVSHELRTPLNVVLGYVDLLLDDSFGALEVGQRDILHRITKNASNLSHLINDLVDLSRMEANRMRIEMEAVELAPLFADLGAVMEVLLAGRDVGFHSTIDAGCEHVYADPDRLKQILSNLLVNAVKFTERGHVDLAAALADDGRVEISVTDTGIGIPTEQHRAIFEPFRQVHDRARRAPGVGLGLSIASRLALLMNGSLRVESAPERGSRFALTLRAPTTERGSLPLRRVS